MNKHKMIKELKNIYTHLKKNDDLKSAINTLKLLAQLQGFFITKIDTAVENLSDAQLDFLLQKMADKYHDA
ncbi:MAG: hypothetical protein CNLJKLNK_00316 [Holosporales bacterium]